MSDQREKTENFKSLLSDQYNQSSTNETSQQNFQSYSEQKGSEESYAEEIKDKILDLDDALSITYKGSTFQEVFNESLKKSHTKSL